MRGGGNAPLSTDRAVATTTATTAKKEKKKNVMSLPSSSTAAPPEQAVDEQTASTESSGDHVTSPTTDKRKRGVPAAAAVAPNNNRRFSRLLRPTSPFKKRNQQQQPSPPKKPRTVERRRSTGSDRPEEEQQLSSFRAPHPQQQPPTRASSTTTTSSIPFLRRNVSLGDKVVEDPNDNTARSSSTRRRSLLFRRRVRRAAPDQEELLLQREPAAPWVEQTRVISVLGNNHNSPRTEQQEEEENKQDELYEDGGPSSCATLGSSLCSSTEIFQHSYLETLCGSHASLDQQDKIYKPKRLGHLPEDPTVQESIEFVFSTSLEEDILRILQLEDSTDNDEDDDDDDMVCEPPAPPSQIQQSIMRTRSDLSRTTPPQGSRRRKRVESVKLSHVGSLKKQASVDAAPRLATTSTATSSSGSCAPCTCRRGQKPALDASRWPQAPLLLRPTPGSGTRVQRIRLVKNDDEERAILWQAGQSSKLTWPQALKQYWGQQPQSETLFEDCDMCEECMILPINNGNEETGETLVTDFETVLFEGTMMLRLRYCNGTTRVPYQDDRGYFTGMNRRYQCVIRGRFKREVPWTECKTGVVLDRPAEKLPAKWILKGAVKVLGFFAPHLEVKFDGPRPMSMTPLGSTPQVLAVHDPKEPYSIEVMQEEPTRKDHTLLGEASTATNTLQRCRFRKKAFDKLYSHQSKELKTDPSKVYTFEFLQHLFNFQDFTVELGSMLGSLALAPIADGQALPIMASHADFDRRLWSFDVWHESLMTESTK